LSSHDDNPATIYGAALATVVSSIEDYLTPVQIGAIKFADGELSDNNPVREVYKEASKMWYYKPGDCKSVPLCLVLLGLEAKAVIDIPYLKTLRRSTIETREAAYRFER
jgi:hypothetical protein